MYNPELTPKPWTFKEVMSMMKGQGWNYNQGDTRFELQTDSGLWIARLKETDYGVNIDAHIIIDGKERMT